MKRFIKETILYCTLGVVAFTIAFTYTFLVSTGVIRIGGKLYIPESHVIEQNTDE